MFFYGYLTQENVKSLAKICLLNRTAVQGHAQLQPQGGATPRPHLAIGDQVIASASKTKVILLNMYFENCT